MRGIYFGATVGLCHGDAGSALGAVDKVPAQLGLVPVSGICSTAVSMSRWSLASISAMTLRFVSASIGRSRSQCPLLG